MSLEKQATVKHKVPSFKRKTVAPACLYCGGWTKTILSTAHHNGQHRRHRCLAEGCEKAFYSLTPFEHGAETITAFKPFKDRALTPLEEHQREQWKEEAKEFEGLPYEVITGQDILSRAARAMRKAPERRDHAESLIVATLEGLEDDLSYMDAGNEAPEDNS